MNKGGEGIEPHRRGGGAGPKLPVLGACDMYCITNIVALFVSQSLVEDLNAGSLDLVEYSMTLEEVFTIEIPAEDAERLTIIGEV